MLNVSLKSVLSVIESVLILGNVIHPGLNHLTVLDFNILQEFVVLNFDIIAKTNSLELNLQIHLGNDGFHFVVLISQELNKNILIADLLLHLLSHVVLLFIALLEQLLQSEEFMAQLVQLVLQLVILFVQALDQVLQAADLLAGLLLLESFGILKLLNVTLKIIDLIFELQLLRLVLNLRVLDLVFQPKDSLIQLLVLLLNHVNLLDLVLDLLSIEFLLQTVILNGKFQTFNDLL